MIDEILGLIEVIVILAGVWIAVFIAGIAVLTVIGIPLTFFIGSKRPRRRILKPSERRAMEKERIENLVLRAVNLVFNKMERWETTEPSSYGLFKAKRVRCIADIKRVEGIIHIHAKMIHAEHCEWAETGVRWPPWPSPENDFKS